MIKAFVLAFLTSFFAMRFVAGVTKHRTGRTGHTVRTGPKYWSFLYEKG